MKDFEETLQHKDHQKSGERHADGNFTGFMQGFMFGKNGGSPNEDDVSDFHDDISSPVLGKYKSQKSEVDNGQTVTVSHINQPEMFSKVQ